MEHYLVRHGAMGRIGRFQSTDPVRHPRGTRVVCRTSRGLEVGAVLAGVGSQPARGTPDGVLLRRLTGEDELYLERLERNKHEAYEACRLMLSERGSSAVLMDLELLFDGRSLIFYFLGEVTEEVESLTDELAQVYDANVQLRRFAETLMHGCGPDCGTEQAPDGGCASSCRGCAIAGACGPVDR